MSGDPPHHPHNRPWDYMIPSWRQPQHAHMAHKHSIIHQPNWHPPTTESMKVLGQIPHNFALHQMFENVALPSQAPPGVDLTLAAVSGAQNGEAAPASPISLSVKDAKKAVAPPPPPASAKPPKKHHHLAHQEEPDAVKLPKRASPLDSVLERLKPSPVVVPDETTKPSDVPVDQPLSVIVPPNVTHDESSDSSTLNVPNVRDDEVTSPCNTEDSLDSNKSRRKRKPSKTLRCTKSDDINKLAEESKKVDEPEREPKPAVEAPQQPIERKRSSSLDSNVVPPKTRRKTSSESETIDNIAAMVHDGLERPEAGVPVSVIKTNSDEPAPAKTCQESTVSESKITLITPAQKKETHFVEIENKLEEMFAGIEDDDATTRPVQEALDESKVENHLTDAIPSTSQERVSSTSSDAPKTKTKKSKTAKKKRTPVDLLLPRPEKKLKKLSKKIAAPRVDASYDSSSNASSHRSRGPFVHIKGPRASPISVNVVNTSSNEDDIEKKIKSKKYHDDSEYRKKVRSKGLHCSTLSNKYDAQTKDATWICVFCKKGPHTTETSLGCPTGDLFGPYFISSDCPEYERRLDDPFDRQFKSKKLARALDETGNKVGPKKSKRKLSEGDAETSDTLMGIVETTNNMLEVWVHEDCLVWSPGVYLVGPKIVGLQEAVWTACNVTCCRCSFKGANVCCLYRGCLRVAHVWCAKSMAWDFDEDNFKIYCKDHRRKVKD